MKNKKLCSMIAFSALIFCLMPSALAALPGSGAAVITPPATAVAGEMGSWNITYTCEDPFTNGTLIFAIPAGWTPPQDSSPTAAGYILVDGDDPLATPVVTISGQEVSIFISNLGNQKHVWLEYGYTSGGTNPGARAQAQTTPENGVIFLVESDPKAVGTPLPIAIPPSLDVVAGPISQLVFTSAPFAFLATGEAGPLTVQAQDEFGNPQTVTSNQQIDLISTSGGGSFSLLGGGSFSPVTSVTMSTGTNSVTFYYRDTLAGAPTITANANGQSWTNAQQQQTVDPGAPVALRVLPSDTTMTAGDFVRLTISAVDAYGNPTPVSNTRTVSLSSAPSGAFYTTSNHTAPITSTTIAVGTASKQVDYLNTNANGGAAHTIIVFTSDAFSPSLLGSTGVTVTHATISTAVSTVAATSPVTANGVANSSVTVTVLDAYGNPISGVAVDLTVDGSAVETDPGATGASGSTVGSVTNTVAELDTVTATADGQPLIDTASILFVAGPVSASASGIVATSPIVADGVTASTITVTARDAQGNPVSGATVALSALPVVGSDLLLSPGGVTGSNGVAEGSLRGVVTGTRTVSAVVNGDTLATTAAVQLIAGSATEFVWSHDGSAVAGVNEDVILIVQDAQGNRVEGYTGMVLLDTNTGGGDVEWALGAGAGGVLVNLAGDQAQYTFDPSDGGSVNLRVSDTRAEMIVLSATENGASGTSAGLPVSAGTADELVLVSGSGQSATVGTAVGSPLVVRVEDSYGNVVSGKAVTFTVLSGGGSIDVVSGGGIDSVVVSGGTGEATCQVWTLGTAAGANSVRAHMTGGSVPSVDFSATGLAGTGVDIVLSPLVQNVTVDAAQLVTARLEDQYGNEVAGKQVTVLITGAADGTLEASGYPTTPISATARYGTTDANGEITVNYRAPSSAGLVDNIDAYGDGATQGAVTDAVYTSSTTGATKLRIVWVSGSVMGAGSTFTFRVEAVDNNNNVDTGNTSLVDLAGEIGGGLVFSESDFGGTVTQVTLAAGEKVVYGRGTTVGLWDITASDNGSGLGSGTETVEIQDAGVVDHYAVSTVDSVVAGASFNVTVEARDAYGNRVLDAVGPVNLTAVEGADSLTATGVALLVTSAPLSSGRVVVGESYTVAEQIRIRVRDAGLKEGYSDVVKVKPAAAYQLVEISGDATGVTAGTSVPLVVEVRDIYGNAVAGENVVFGILGGGGFVVPPNDASGANGRVTVFLTTGTAAGTNRVRATILDGTPMGLETVEFVVETVASGIAYYTVVPAKLSLTAGETINVTVSANDALNNLVTEDNTTVVELGSTTGNAIYGLTPGTLTGGVYTTTMHDETAETLELTAQTQGGGASGTSAVITVTNAVAYQVTKVSGDTTGVEVGTRKRLWVEVNDQYGNAVPGQVVIYTKLSDLGGTAYLRDAVNDTTDGNTSTGANGRAWIDLVTAVQAGENLVRASIFDGNPANLETKTFSVTTTAGAIDPGISTVVATSPIIANGTASSIVTVTVKDAQSNPISGVTVALSVSGSANPLNPGSPTDANGIAIGQVTDTVAETVTVTVTADGTGLTASPVVQFVPGPPFGTITATATQDTITANGSSKTTITSGTIQDEYGNTVAEGSAVSVFSSLGTVSTPHLTNALSVISFDLTSGTTAGTAAVTMTSVAGSAAGTKNIYFAESPAFQCQTYLAPNVVVPGDPDSVAFRSLLRNSSATGVFLSTNTTFEFTDGAEVFLAHLAAPHFLAAGATDTLSFAKAFVPAAMTPGNYQPVVHIRGTDEYDEAFDKSCALPSNSLLVSAIEIVSITSPFSVVSTGQVVPVYVSIKNKGGQNVEITNVSLSFTPPGGSFTPGASPDLPATIGPGLTVAIEVPVTINPSTIPGSYQIDASAAGTISGTPVTDDSVAPYPVLAWTVQLQAALFYSGGTLLPQTVSQGQSHSFSAQIRNDGSAAVTLTAAATRLYFFEGADTFSVNLKQSVGIPGGSSQNLEFNSGTIPAGIAAGRRYDVQLYLAGDENGSSFTELLNTSGEGDSVLVVAPAQAVYLPGSLIPSRVSKSTAVSFAVRVTNSGGGTVILNPDSTRFSFAGGQYNARLDGTFTAAIAPGDTTITFVSRLIDPSLAAPFYFPSVRVVGTENGIPFARTLGVSDTLFVEEPPLVSINAIRTTQPFLTADQSKAIGLWMSVTNSGQASVELDSARVRFFLGGIDRTIQFDITNPVEFFESKNTLLTGGGTDSLYFTVADNIANSMSTGSFIIEGDLWVTDQNNQQQIHTDTDLGGKGNVTVQSPAGIAIQSIVPSQAEVTVQQTKQFQIRMAVRNPGGSDLQIDFAPANTSLTFDQGTTWAWIVRSQMASGLTILPGGATDTLIFDVQTAGDIAAVTRIDGLVRSVEINSDRVLTFNTASAGSGYGSIDVQTPPVVVVQRVTPVAPNAPSVNIDQRFPVAVELRNTGQADAAAVEIFLDPSSGSSVEPPQQKTIALLAGGGSVIDTFFVRTDITPGNDTLAVDILQAIDANSDEILTVFGPHPQDRAVIIKERPAAFTVDATRPSQASVTRQQTTPWFITIEFHNGGDADLILTPPAANDITFLLGAVPQSGYVVTAPAAFLSGSPGWTLPGGGGDSLRYRVDQTGSAVGEVRFEVALRGTDRNDAKVQNVLGDSTVTVQSSAGLWITDVSTDAFNTPQAGLAVVNTGQSFQVIVTVQNSGEDVRNVEVTLGRNGSSTIFSSPSAHQTIDKDSTASYAFPVNASAVPTVQEIFTATITNAISVNSGLPVTPQPPDDNTENIIIQTPADLAVRTWISDPARVADDTLSTDQLFDVFAVVQNQGTAAVDNSGTFAISLPSGFQLDPGSQAAEIGFTAGTNRSWQVRAPAAQALDQPISVGIVTVPLDINSNMPASVSAGTDIVTADVLEKAGFISTGIGIIAPAGAVDNTLSTEQVFTLRGTVVAEPTATDIRATIVLPPGFTIDPGDDVVVIGDGDGTAQTADFIVRAPLGAASGNLRIDFTAVDENTGNPVSDSVTRPVTVVLKALLTLSAEIVGPTEALDHTVTPSLQFTLGASVSNGAGRAGVDTTGSSPRIFITDFNTYLVTSPQLQAFTTGQRVEWNLTAPTSLVGPVAIKFIITRLPLDENSGQPAAVSGALETTIPIQMETERIQIANVTKDVGFETDAGPVPQGRKDIGMLGMEVYNPSENENAVRVEWIDVTVLDRDDHPIAEPALIFSELSVRTQAGATYSGVLSANPVRIDFGAAVTLSPADFDTFRVYVSIADNAPEGQFSLSIEDTSDIYIFDTLSNGTMTIVDKGTQQGEIKGRYRSRGLVIGSGNFNEYVRNYPNPFGAGREETKIAYFMETAGAVSIRIYSLRGDLVFEWNFANGTPETQPGVEHKIPWDGRNMNGDVVRNGIYICQVQAGGNSVRIKIAVAK
jgi:hypothetical protein